MNRRLMVVLGERNAVIMPAKQSRRYEAYQRCSLACSYHITAWGHVCDGVLGQAVLKPSKVQALVFTFLGVKPIISSSMYHNTTAIQISLEVFCQFRAATSRLHLVFACCHQGLLAIKLAPSSRLAQPSRQIVSFCTALRGK